MKGTLKPRVKICCISSVEEAGMAIEFGASALGLVGPMPSGPGVIPDELIKEIAKKTPPGVSSFLLTSETSVEAIVRHHRLVNTSTIQMVDALTTGSYDQIREQLPAIKLVQVIHVTDERSVEQAIEMADKVDAILLDSGNPNLPVKQLGGTGRVHNWGLSRTIREEIDIPLFLAGGITEQNVVEAINYVRPFGIDLCSGVRTNGKLDKKKLKRLFNAINSIKS